MNTNTNCIIECKIIRESIRNADKVIKENLELVYKRGKVKGYFTTFKCTCGENNEKSLIVSKIKMEYDEKFNELLAFQYDRDYIHINRVSSEVSDITDADIANIILEVEKEVEKPIMYTNNGKPTYWFNGYNLWQLRAEEINLEWFYRY